jgi:hypothetical protein
VKIKKALSKKKREKTPVHTEETRRKSSDAYGDKIPICANLGCALRKKAKCFGFEGCPGFQAK